MKKNTYAWIGAASAVASTAMIIGYALRRKKNEAVCSGVLLAGIAGLLGGALIAYEPERKKRMRLTVRELLDEADARMCEASMEELLGDGTLAEEETETV
ncbi:MAG: hypothetical protein IKJ35_02345 [Clostridia bacterium]|nr:hypothetical protein [Clostridia bacterium]